VVDGTVFPQRQRADRVPQSPLPLTQADVELRKVYDTTSYGRSNEGHWWTSRDTLSESDVEDLLAYLKTL
jgi:hypothetical protein